ncbi:MAG: glycosyltransferase family 2 protein [Deltaproteobacteria bacterium]|nr:glycosyltransferase family 2 protein [Deltaproteobacteria bacterium]
MKLSVVIPVHNEAGCIEKTVLNLVLHLRKAVVEFEILVVNDNSTDATAPVLERLSLEYPEVRRLCNPASKGFGLAVRTGLEAFSGDAAAIVMGDGSDSPEDVVRFFRKLEEGFDCVFGSRFMKGGYTRGYPVYKLILNRVVNQFIRILFGLTYNDTTNAFKMYRRKTIEGLRPFLSHHFNLTVELPLKAITRGYSYAILPNGWTNRKTGTSKLALKEMGSRYLFIILYCLIEKWLSVGDYRKGTGER